MVLVLGLGNPGGKYVRTRHNIGFRVADRLAERDGAVCDRKQLGADTAKVRVGGESAVVAKPRSYMNESGQPAASLRGYYKLANRDIVVIHDDLELPFGQIRVKDGGGHAGHNGLRDLQHRLGGNDFLRVRVGIGRPPEGWGVADYVLSAFSDEEERLVPELVDLASDAVGWAIAEGAGPADARVRAALPAGVAG